MTIEYPGHKHPHGIDDIAPNKFRIWLCGECLHIFTDREIRKDKKGGYWGHCCKAHPCRKGQRCESHLEPYMPVLDMVKTRVPQRKERINGKE